MSFGNFATVEFKIDGTLNGELIRRIKLETGGKICCTGESYSQNGIQFSWQESIANIGYLVLDRI